jgi:hypothetical protein
MNDRKRAYRLLQETVSLIQDRARFRQVATGITGQPLTAEEEPLPVIMMIDEVSELFRDPEFRRLLEYALRHGRGEHVIVFSAGR